MTENERNQFKKQSYYFYIGGVLVALAGSVLMFSGMYFERQAENNIRSLLEAFDQGIESDTENLLRHARELDAERTFDRYIESGDIAQLLSAAVAERDRRGFDGLLITDQNGIVLTRSKAVQQRGDFIYYTTVWGQKLQNGREVTTVEKGAAHPLDVLGAVPMVRDGAHFGSIVAAYIVDNAYAAKFKKRYLDPAVEIAFLVDEKGVVGHSFEDSSYGRILSFYFNGNGDLTDEAGTVRHVAFNGDEYFVSYAPFKGVHVSPGGVLLFVPTSLETQAAVVGFAATLLFVGLFLILVPHLFRGRWLPRTLLCVLGIISVWGATYMLYSDHLLKSLILLTRPEFAIYNSTLELDPPVAAFNQQFEHRIGIRLFSGGESINAIEVNVSFDPELAQVADIDFSRSFCNQDLIIERSIDNETGEIRIICGIPTPGFSDWAGIVADLAIQPLREGTLELSFGPNTQVLANDGLGTEVLRYAVNGSYIIAEGLLPVGGGPIDKLLIFSPTHPNQVRWYKSREATFTWTRHADDREYWYLLNQEATTTDFSEAIPVDGHSVTAEVPGDGVYYFHLTYRDNGTTQHITHHKIMIDTEPPDPPQVRVSTNEPLRGELVRFEFVGADRLSGLQKNFYLQLNNGIYFPVGKTFSTAFFEPGEHTVTLRSFDVANNFSETQVTLRVQSSFARAVKNIASVIGF